MTKRTPKINEIVIQFVDPVSKTVVETMTRTVPDRKRVPNPRNWTAQEAARRFCWYLSRNYIDLMTLAADRAIECKCFHIALKQCQQGRKPNLKKLKSLLSLWNNRGLHSIPLSLGSNLGLFADAMRFFAPPYKGPRLELYRGQSLDRHNLSEYGIAWTTKVDVATEFAELRDSPGVVLKILADPEMIIAHMPTHGVNGPRTKHEDEYLIDPSMIVNRVSAIQFTKQIGNSNLPEFI